ncbi:MAG: tetratricopeptide repeat protein [Verrucomicrobiaceae bacterium]|nr:tetratricopeptide repeat protein [Verrucomicrobiaceae bacterium]
MSVSATRAIFLSAVSQEFHRCPPENPRAFESYRFVLKAAFEKLAPHYEVIIQEDLAQGTTDLLKTLDDEIARSTLVVHLVGDLAGWKPEAACLRRLRERHGDRFLSAEPELKAALGDESTISYTQWEAYLAFHHQRPRVLVFTATAETRRSPLFEPDPTQRDSQERHRQRLGITGAHRADFTDQRHVAYRALRSFLHDRLDPGVDPVEPADDALGEAWAHQRDIVDQLAAAIRKPDPRLILENDPARVVTFVAALRQCAGHWQVNLRTILDIAARHEAALEAAAASDPSTETLHDLAFAAFALGDYGKAQSIAQSAAEFALQLAADQPADAAEHRRAAVNAHLLQHQAAQTAHDIPAAIRALQSAGALVDKAADPLLWAEVHEPLARFLLDHAHYDEADDLISDLVDIREEFQGEHHPDLAGTLLLWGGLLDAQGKYEGVISVTARAERIFAAQLPPQLTGVAAAINNRAQALKATNRLAEAEPLMRRALAIDEASFGKDHPNVAIGLNNLAQLLQATNRLAEAEPLMRRALAIDEASFGMDHPNVATSLNNLAGLLQDTDRLAEAEPLMRRALAIDEASFGKDHPDVARDLNNLAQLLKDTNRLAEAEPLMRRALAIDEASFGMDHPNVAIRLNNLAQLLQATNRLAEAEPLMRRVVLIVLRFTRTTGHPHPHLRTVLNNYAIMLQEWKGNDAVRDCIFSLGPESGLDEADFLALLQQVFGG